MLFGNFPIVYQEARGWNEDIGGCAFLEVLVGMLSTLVHMIIYNSRYNKVAKRRQDCCTTSEDRFPPAMVVSVLIPIGNFWFAWTNYPSIRWIVTILAAAQFKFGMVLVFISTFNYLVDSYTKYAVSVFAANPFLHSLYGAPFPLFITQVYHNLGIHWDSSIPAFLASFCASFCFIFYHYEVFYVSHDRYKQ